MEQIVALLSEYNAAVTAVFGFASGLVAQRLNQHWQAKTAKDERRVAWRQQRQADIKKILGQFAERLDELSRLSQELERDPVGHVPLSHYLEQTREIGDLLLFFRRGALESGHPDLQKVFVEEIEIADFDNLEKFYLAIGAVYQEVNSSPEEERKGATIRSPRGK